MSFDFQTTLLITVYTLQILVMSFVAPRSVQRSLALMIERYPAKDYPKLYPVSQERMERHFALYRPLHNAIGIGGFALLALGLFYFDSLTQLARAWILFSLVQVIPAVLRAGWQLQVVRAFRKMPPPDVRTAELRHWRATDFAPPWLIGAGIIGSLLALACAGIAYAQPQHSLYVITVCGVASLALLVRMIQLVTGAATLRRDDPYMSQPDIFSTRERRVRSLFTVGAFVGLYSAFMLLYTSHLVRVDFVFVCIGVSALYQLITLRLAIILRRMISTRDFSVYQPTAQRTPPPAASHPPTVPTSPSARQ